jgi:hypothetical protein
MLNTIISFLIATLLIHFLALATIFGQSAGPNPEIIKIKTDLARRGIGEKSKVKIELRDGSEIKGYLAELNAEDFVVADSKTGGRTTLAYHEVKKVKNQGLSLGAKLGIVGLALGAGLAIGVVSNRKINCQICP